jgi:CBS-domain-containing membrane protein
MQAHDVMTTDVIAVGPDTDIREAARLLVQHHISAVPVIDKTGKLAGIVSEGDLMRRPESGTERRPSWWLSIFLGPEEQTHAYVKSHGRRAADVMTSNVITVDEHTPLEQVASVLERYRIKRVPVTRDGKVVGIVSRADLLHGLIARQAGRMPSVDDRTIKAQVLKGLAEAGISQTLLSVVVSAGKVHIWGVVENEEEREAVRIAAEGAPGVKEAQLEVNVMPRAKAMMME